MAWMKTVAAMAAVAMAAAPASAQRDNWNKPTEPFHIAGNLYYVGTEGLASYLVVTSEGAILIDGALPDSVPQIEANIAKLSFNLKDVKIILNSHAHFDHSGGLAQLKKDTGAQLIAHQGDVALSRAAFILAARA